MTHVLVSSSDDAHRDVEAEVDQVEQPHGLCALTDDEMKAVAGGQGNYGRMTGDGP